MDIVIKNASNNAMVDLDPRPHEISSLTIRTPDSKITTQAINHIKQTDEKLIVVMNNYTTQIDILLDHISSVEIEMLSNTADDELEVEVEVPAAVTEDNTKVEEEARIHDFTGEDGEASVEDEGRVDVTEPEPRLSVMRRSNKKFYAITAKNKVVKTSEILAVLDAMPVGANVTVDLAGSPAGDKTLTGQLGKDEHDSKFSVNSPGVAHFSIVTGKNTIESYVHGIHIQ